MKDSINLSVYEIVGSSLCVASNDGEKVFERSEKALKQDRKVVLSFMNVNSLTSAFLNAAIGQLYGVFSEQDIRENFKVEDMEPDDIALLKRVVETAKAYFKDPARFAEVQRAVLEEDDGM